MSDERQKPALMTREQIMDRIKECAKKLGHSPSFAEFRRATNLKKHRIKAIFGSFSLALRACGLEPRGCGHRETLEKLFADWARVARAVGRVPTLADYELKGAYSHRPLTSRFGGWMQVAVRLLQYAEQHQLEEEWGDVLEMVRRRNLKLAGSARGSRGVAGSAPGEAGTPGVLPGRRVYGEALSLDFMPHAPTNEAGVLLLFGALAAKLRFKVIWVGTEFPDLEVMREVAPGKWQRIHVELEFQSRNFLKHGHELSECDLIVCWEHNWPECPIEVIELKKVVKG